MGRLLEEAELDEEQEKKLEREFAREYHLITREDRLETVAKDIVEHFTGQGFKGKAMVVCIDKATAVKMYDKVQKSWNLKLDNLREQIGGNSEDRISEIEDLIQEMEDIDMAVVVSQGLNEIREMEEKGLDIRPHRKRIVEEDLETKFKDPDDPFRLVFVCAMWMTGFDVPSCSTLYLDKPMRNHTLMQTIARANRVYADKVNGLIVDYVGVFRNLERALAIYGTGRKDGVGELPVEDKTVLVQSLNNTIQETMDLCKEKGADLAAIEAAEGFERIGRLDDAVEALVGTDGLKRRFLDLANNVQRLYKAVLPDPAARAAQAECSLIRVLADKIRALSPPVDITDVMQQVEDLLDSSIDAEGYVIRETSEAFGMDHLVDLSGIDFEALKAKFERGRRHTEVERIKGAIGRQLQKMVRLNRSRMDYLERFQRMIDDYNAGSLNVEEFFRRLMEFAQNLNQEEQRAVGEQLTEEELAVFDLLTKPEMDLTAKERTQVKKTAHELLETLKREKLVIDWRKRQQARAEVRVTIETLLDRGLPEAYTPEIYQKKSDAVFQHVYDCYFGADKSVYSMAA